MSVDAQDSCQWVRKSGVTVCANLVAQGVRKSDVSPTTCCVIFQMATPRGPRRMEYSTVSVVRTVTREVAETALERGRPVVVYCWDAL